MSPGSNPDASDRANLHTWSKFKRLNEYANLDFRLKSAPFVKIGHLVISGSNAFLPVFTYAVKKSSPYGTLYLTIRFRPFGKIGDIDWIIS